MKLSWLEKSLLISMVACLTGAAFTFVYFPETEAKLTDKKPEKENSLSSHLEPHDFGEPEEKSNEGDVKVRLLSKLGAVHTEGVFVLPPNQVIGICDDESFRVELNGGGWEDAARAVASVQIERPYRTIEAGKNHYETKYVIVRDMQTEREFAVIRRVTYEVRPWVLGEKPDQQ